MKLLTKDQIQACINLRSEVVFVPEWGGDVMVRELTGEERDSYEQSIFEARRVGNKTEITPNLRNVKARMVVRCVINEDGTRLFGDADVEWVGKKSASALNRIVDVAERLSGLTKKDVAELEKNSATGQPEGSSSGSPGI